MSDMHPSIEKAGRHAELEENVILFVPTYNLREAQPHCPNTNLTPPSILWHFLSILKGSSIKKVGGGLGTQTSGRGKLKQR